MPLIVQGTDIETALLKEIARASGASAIEQVRPNVFQFAGATRVEGIAELCARHGIEWTFVNDPG